MTDATGLVVVVAGPSGVGKGCVHRGVREVLPDSALSVSVTTRAPRPGEIDGVDYRFVDRATFQEMIDGHDLLEWAEYAGNLYGTPRTPVVAEVAQGNVVVLDIEVQGAVQIKDSLPGALLVFLVPPSFEELERRLRGRGTEDDATVRRRLAVAREEIAEQDAFDVVVVNDDLDRCVAEVVHHIEMARAGHRP
ncbi:MAG: guanylate kinase [Nitriliruptor sp.]|nr:MAG: guanylate kinase [Nitriliruptor sp.]